MRRCPQASHLPQDHPRGRRAGSHRGDDTSRTSWRGGVLCSAPCKGRPPDASRPGPRTRCGSRPCPPRPPRGSRRGVAGGRARPASRRRQVVHAYSLGVASCTTPRLQGTKMDSGGGDSRMGTGPARSAPRPPCPRPPRRMPAPPAPDPRRSPRRPPAAPRGAGGSSKVTRTRAAALAPAGAATHRGGGRAGGRWQDAGRSAEGLRHARLEGPQLGQRRGAKGAGAGAAVS